MGHRPTGQCDISPQKHHSQRKGGPVGAGGRRNACVSNTSGPLTSCLPPGLLATSLTAILACNLTGNLPVVSNLSSTETSQQVGKLEG